MCLLREGVEVALEVIGAVVGGGKLAAEVLLTLAGLEKSSSGRLFLLFGLNELRVRV